MAAPVETNIPPPPPGYNQLAYNQPMVAQSQFGAYQQPYTNDFQYAPAQAPGTLPGAGMPATMPYGPTPGMPTYVVRGTARSRYPYEIICPNCQTQVQTVTSLVAGGATWMVAGIIFAIGVFTFFPLFFCWIPFCIDGTKDVHHQCPNCRKPISVTRAG